MDHWQRLRVIDRKDWAPGLMTLALGGQPQPFCPGQFVNLATELGDKKLKRAYSLASAPGQNYEFLISRVPGGMLTPRLFEFKPGDILEVESQANGMFTLDWLPDFARELWLLGTGTGLGPFMSLLRTEALLFPRFSQVNLVHCVRTRNQLAYASELERYAATEPRFRYLPMLSREANGAMLGGRIPANIESGQLEWQAALEFSAERSHFMLCGNPAMIREVQVLLEARGLRKHRRKHPGHVTTEKYWK